MWPWEISQVDDLPNRPASMGRNAKHQFLLVVGRALLCFVSLSRLIGICSRMDGGLTAILLQRGITDSEDFKLQQ